MRLNLRRIQSAAQNKPEHALNDSRENSSIAPFERTNSGHGLLVFSGLQ
jgi:hypothetical protein